MIFDRREIKQRAREIILGARPRVLVAGVLFVALGAVAGFLSNRLTGVSMEELARYQEYLLEGSTEYAMAVWRDAMPSPAAQLIDAALQIAVLIVGVGFTVFLFNTVRQTGAVYGNLLDGFGPYIRVVLLQMVVAVLVGLWALLLIVPGVVAYYRYSMAVFIMLDHPDYGILQCIRESKRMTAGYKQQLFTLDLSLLGYVLLCMVPVAGYAVQVWYTPYRETSYILFYEKLRAGESREE